MMLKIMIKRVCLVHKRIHQSMALSLAKSGFLVRLGVDRFISAWTGWMPKIPTGYRAQ